MNQVVHCSCKNPCIKYFAQERNANFKSEIFCCNWKNVRNEVQSKDSKIIVRIKLLFSFQ